MAKGERNRRLRKFAAKHNHEMFGNGETTGRALARRLRRVGWAVRNDVRTNTE